MTKHELTLQLGLAAVVTQMLASTAPVRAESPVAVAPGGQISPTLEAQILLDDLLGLPITTASGESLGKVRDLLVHHDGEPKAIVISERGIRSLEDARSVPPLPRPQSNGTGEGDLFIADRCQDLIQSNQTMTTC